MVEDNLCRECGSELDPNLKYCPNCKCNVEMEKIEKIDDTPQKIRPKNSFQKLTESVLWGIMMVVIGGLIISYAVFSFEWTNSFEDLFVACLLFGLGGGVAMPALMAMAVLHGNSTGAMGSVMGILAMAHSLGMLIGSFIGGLMMDIFQLRHAFPSGAVIMIICVGLFVGFTYHKKEVPAMTDLKTGPVDLEA